MRTFLCLLCMLFSLPSFAQVWHGVERTLRYKPVNGDFVSVNSKLKQNRALYGGYTPFRVETGDVPEFALAYPEMCGNLHFGLTVKGKSVQLNDADRVEAHYGGGRRFYIITDPLLGEGKLNVEVVARTDVEGMVVKITPVNIPSGVHLSWIFGGASNERLNRNGDLGVDKSDCYSFKTEFCKNNRYTVDGNHFIMDTGGKKNRTIEGMFPDKLVLDSHNYVKGETTLDRALYISVGSVASSLQEIPNIFDIALAEAEHKADALEIHTPDPYFNTLGSDISMAADGIWQPNVWLHGAIGWRIPLCGWRAAYTGDVLGWHERSRRHFDGYAAAQVLNIPPTIPQPAQDTALNLCRGLEKWGTPIFSNGYISRYPGGKDMKVNHYDMNLVYIDELIRHLNWTGDTAYARKVWSVIVRSLAWEKRNFDSDNDGLYDAYCCIWASDGLEYSGGAVTHSSSYNYYSNLYAARLACILGFDATLYEKEAQKIYSTINKRLWLPDDGHSAEYQDAMGYKLIHPSAGVWSIYTPVDSKVGNMEQRYEATRYVDTEIPHIPVVAKGLRGRYSTISTTNWLPYMWSTNNVAVAEVAHTALAYWETGRNEVATNLLKSSILDNMYMSSSPGNFGQISFYDASLGEEYRDFGDVVGITSRAIVEGLFGVRPDLLNGTVVISPGFPKEWNEASIRTSDVNYSFNRKNYDETWKVRFNTPCKNAVIKLEIPVYTDSISMINLNGKDIHYSSEMAMHNSIERPRIAVTIPCNNDNLLTFHFAGKAINTSIITEGNGENTVFENKKQGCFEWIQPQFVNRIHKEPEAVDNVRTRKYHQVKLSSYFNDDVTNIFKHSYLSPRPSVTSLEIPIHGIGDWCHPNAAIERNDVSHSSKTVVIDDSGVRAKCGQLRTPDGIPFLTPAKGHNIVFTSLWNNFPDSVLIKVSGKYRRAWLLMAGTTNQMQSRLENGRIKAVYTDGSVQIYSLRNPDNWAPIEQNYYEDGYAFHNKSGLLTRLLLQTGKFAEVNGGLISGGGGLLLNMPLYKTKELKSITLETRAYEVIIGLMALTFEE